MKVIYVRRAIEKQSEAIIPLKFDALKIQIRIIKFH